MKAEDRDKARNTTILAMMLLLVLGAGPALSDGPGDPGDLAPHYPPLCPEDPPDGPDEVPAEEGEEARLIAAGLALLVRLALP